MEKTDEDWEAEVEEDFSHNDFRETHCLGQSEGLKAGLELGETKGFAFGFQQEYSVAFELGRVLGTAHALMKLKLLQGAHSSALESLSQVVSEIESQVGEHFWTSSPLQIQGYVDRVKDQVSRILLLV